MNTYTSFLSVDKNIVSCLRSLETDLITCSISRPGLNYACSGPRITNDKKYKAISYPLSQTFEQIIINIHLSEKTFCHFSSNNIAFMIMKGKLQCSANFFEIIKGLQIKQRNN